MKIDIHCKGTNLTDAIREHVEEKLSKIDRLLRGEVEVLVVLNYSAERTTQMAEVNFRAWGQDIVSKAEGEDLYKAVTALVDQVASQVKRIKDKKGRRKGAHTFRTYDNPPPPAEPGEELEEEFAEEIEEEMALAQEDEEIEKQPAS
jgi:putative sigma-54 modulation protein